MATMSSVCSPSLDGGIKYLQNSSEPYSRKVRMIFSCADSKHWSMSVRMGELLVLPIIASSLFACVAQIIGRSQKLPCRNWPKYPKLDTVYY